MGKHCAFAFQATLRRPSGAGTTVAGFPPTLLVPFEDGALLCGPEACFVTTGGETFQCSDWDSNPGDNVLVHDGKQTVSLRKLLRLLSSALCEGRHRDMNVVYYLRHDQKTYTIPHERNCPCANPVAALVDHDREKKKTRPQKHLPLTPNKIATPPTKRQSRRRRTDVVRAIPFDKLCAACVSVVKASNDNDA